MERGLLAKVHGRHHWTSIIAEKEAINPICEEQLVGKEARNRGQISDDTGGSIIRLSEDRHSSDTADPGSKG
jgi:hypothetical protein